MVARSLAVTNSVSFNTFDSAARSALAGGALGVEFAFFLAPLHALLLAFVFGGEACKHLLHLLLHIFFVDLCVASATRRVVVFTTAAIFAAAFAATLTATAVTSGLVALLLDVDLLLGADALALLALVGAACGTGILTILTREALVATLLLALFAGTCRLVDGRKVDFADNIDGGAIFGQTH